MSRSHARAADSGRNLGIHPARSEKLWEGGPSNRLDDELADLKAGRRMVQFSEQAFTGSVIGETVSHIGGAVPAVGRCCSTEVEPCLRHVLLVGARP